MSNTSSPPFTLTAAVAEDAAAFARLLNGAYSVPVDGQGRRMLPDAELMARVHAVISPEFALADWAMMRLATDETLTPYQYGMLDASERIIARLAGTLNFHPHMAELLNRHRGLFAAAALPADGWITNPQHPARRMLACLYSLAAGWHPELGPGAISLKQQAEGWLTSIAGPSGWEKAVAAATHWLEDEHRRLDRLEKRLIDAESGQMRERRARQVAARTLNQAFADRLIGPEVASMLLTDWLPALQWTLLRHGEQGLLWQRFKRATGSLRWTLSPEIGEENKLYRLVGQFGDEMTELGPQVFHDVVARERVTAILENEHLCILRNLPRDTVLFTPVDAHDAVADASTTLSEHLIEPVRQLAVGQWLQVQDGAVTRRVRLLVRQEETRQLLFVNALGGKALVANYEQLAIMLADGTALTLPEKVPLHACIAAVIEELRQRHQLAQQSRIEQLRMAREQAAADARIKEAARQKALAEAQVLEAARRESQRKAAESQRENEAAQQAAANARSLAENDARIAAQQRQQRARLMASSLTIGAWVVFHDAGGRIDRRRLSVVLPSSGKCIFVDADGAGKSEVTREELIRGLADGSISPLRQDQKVDDALTRVVDNLRHERGQSGSTP